MQLILQPHDLAICFYLNTHIQGCVHLARGFPFENCRIKTKNKFSETRWELDIRRHLFVHQIYLFQRSNWHIWKL